ncbi:MAG: YeeE/YedE thiosulfate transporter family protein [Thermoplasmatota archaeon]
MNWLYLARWSPYAVGAGIGILIWFSFILSNRPIGCSTAYARISGMIEKLFRGSVVEQKTYYQKFVPRVDWEMMLIIGIILGAFVSSLVSGTFTVELVPSLWKTAFGSNMLVRFAGAICGGFLIGFGARMAGGCTSGHGISGTLQLAVSSWLAFFCFFLGGFVTAIFLYTFVGGI